MNSSPEELAAAGPARAAAASVAKRKDLMEDVKSRLNTGYNMNTYGKKNIKELDKKVKFFEKKIAEGKFKEFMRPRLEEAKTLLARVEALRATPLAAKAAVPAPAEPLRSKAPALRLAAPAAVTGRAKTQKNKSLKVKAKPLEAAVAARGPAVVVPPPVPVVVPNLRKSRKIRKGTVPPAARERLNTILEAAEGEGEAENENLGVVAAPRATRPRLNQVQNDFLYEASQKYLPLPEFYDPYTGRKIPPEESPLTPIERAYKQLKKIRRAAFRNAATLRAVATGKGKSTRRNRRH